MYQFSRLLLTLSVGAGMYCIIIVTLAAWPASAWGLALIGGLVAIRKGRRPLTTLGSARWASETDLSRAGMLGASRGLILGRLPQAGRRPVRLGKLFSRHVSAKDACAEIWSPRMRHSQLVRLPRAIHTAVFSPSGGGKGVSCVIPHCMTCEDSMVVLDPKGEIARATAHIRRKRFGHKTVLLDPYSIVTPTPNTYNPIDFIDKDHPQAIELCRNLGNALVVRSPEEREPHWRESSALWVSAMIATVVVYGHRGESRSLKTVYEFLSHPERRELAVKLMCESTCWDGTLAAMGGQLMNFIEKERSSVMTTIARHLSFIGTPAVMASIADSDFDPRLLRAGRQTVYLILPPSHQRTQAGLMRLWMASLLECVVSGGLQE